MYQATNHSIEQMKNRQGINRKNAETKIKCALLRGKSAECFNSWERNFLSSEGRDGCVAIAYDGYCYIVSESNDCVTLYPLPAWFGKKKRFDGKEKIRNAKKYYSYNSNYFANEVA